MAAPDLVERIGWDIVFVVASGQGMGGDDPGRSAVRPVEQLADKRIRIPGCAGRWPVRRVDGVVGRRRCTASLRHCRW